MLELIIILAVILTDQAVKFVSERALSPLGTSVPLIDGVFHFTSTHNTGAAWGMLSGGRWIFIILTVVICTGILYVLVRTRKVLTLCSRISLSLIFAGAVGNWIDRLFLGYVRDMFDFCLIQFPIFNIADSALTIGAILLVVDVLFLKDRSIMNVDQRMKKAREAAASKNE